MTNKTLMLVFALVITAVASGCASITRGSKDALTIETEPSGANCTLSTGQVCSSTPCTLRMPRKSEGTASCKLEGYADASGNWTHKTAGSGAAGMAGNVLLGGLIGVAVDAGTGATQDLTPNPLRITMRKLGDVVEEPEAVEVVSTEPETTKNAPAKKSINY